MRDALDIVQQGGPVMIPLLVLSLVLYERCFHLLLFLIRFNRRIVQATRRGQRSNSWAERCRRPGVSVAAPEHVAPIGAGPASSDRGEPEHARGAGAWPADLARLREIQLELRQRFEHDGMVIASLVAAAPLLGLLGTVMGMVSTFESISAVAGSGPAGGLASGISMALITTETGLAIAIPAVIVVYYAQRQLQRVLGRLVQLEDRAAPEG